MSPAAQETDLLTTGMIFVRGLPTAATPLDGQWQYTLPCVTHYASGQKTRITIVQKGEDARAFYCANQAALRPGQPLRAVLHHPTVAADRNILICLPDQGADNQPDLPDFFPGIVSKYAKKAANVSAADGIAAAEIIIPTNGDICIHCKGTGKRYHQIKKPCTECDGSGEFDYKNITYECKHCDGAGFLETNDRARQRDTCGECSGFGCQPANICINDSNVYLADRYIRLISALPNARVYISPNHMPQEPALFTFDGGWGVVMPVKMHTTTAKQDIKK